MNQSGNVEIKFSKVSFSENTYTTQSFQARDYSYFYDKEYDSIIGTQIMYFKKRSLETLKKYLPKFLVEIVEELNIII